jgi:hypothetical protein
VTTGRQFLSTPILAGTWRSIKSSEHLTTVLLDTLAPSLTSMVLDVLQNCAVLVGVELHPTNASPIKKIRDLIVQPYF